MSFYSFIFFPLRFLSSVPSSITLFSFIQFRFPFLFCTLLYLTTLRSSLPSLSLTASLFYSISCSLTSLSIVILPSAIFYSFHSFFCFPSGRASVMPTAHRVKTMAWWGSLPNIPCSCVCLGGEKAGGMEQTRF